MKDMGTIYGSENQAKPLIVGVDTVYVHTDIEAVTEDAEGKEVEGLFKYHEVQYDKDEYIEIMAQKNTELEAELTSTQVALCDVYELIAG